ncbi:ATP-binding cassette, subfamily B (MDR/TAP), member 1 [Pseudohyphozyma bogoriensis]|nr:ATP-binding cassette, subfamily B (MDR/TAP), member 1 [Pseudohyphozyma bogoriensis]
MASSPSRPDPALAALSSLPPPVIDDEDEDEHSTEHLADRSRRDSVPRSFVSSSDYTSGNSVYDDPQGSFAASQATITRSTTDLSIATGTDNEFADASESVGGSRTDLAVAPDEDRTVTLDQATPSPNPTGETTAAAAAEQTPRAQQGAFEPAAEVAAMTSVVAPAVATKTGPVPTANSGASTASGEKRAGTPETTSDEKGGEAKRKKGSKKSGGSGDKTPTDESIEMEEDPEMAGLTDEQRRIVMEQVFTAKTPLVSFFQLFRFNTKFEIFLNVVGLFFAIVAGAAQPLMTVVFGAITTSFTAYGTALANVNQPGGQEALQQSINDVYHNIDKDVLYLVYIGIGMLVSTFIYMATVSLVIRIYTGEAATRRIREKYLQAVLRQNVAYFDKMGPGEVTTRIQTDTHLIQEGISDKVSITVQFISIFITGFVVAIVRNWRLALVLSTIIPCIAGAGGVMNHFMSGYRRQMLEATAEGGTLAEEVISSVRNAHAFGTQKKLTAMYGIKNDITVKLGMTSSIFNGAGMSLIVSCQIYGSYGLAFYYGTTLLIQGRATSGEVVNVFFSILIGAFSLAQIAPNLQAIAFARGAATSIFTCIDRVPVIDSASPAGVKPEKVEGVIQVENVDFLYPSRPGVQVLHKFNGVFPRGKMTALVGASGSGKSTIIGLIERFYDPVGGIVRLDGIDLRDLNVKWLRSQIGLVSQEPTLFATTVAGNIEHGLIGTKFINETPEQKRERVVAAAIQANADGFIQNLPEGYDTMIGERGMLLSGGQKQRIAIARAIVGDPQILLLDEATSALDTASEHIVQDALDKAAAGRTTITIAHRLSTIKDADQIIVLSAGHILESAMTNEEGSAHTRLLKNPDGAYSRLVSAQRFRERTEEEEEDSDEEVPAGATLTSEQIAEMAANEKPMFETLKRTGTGRSAASAALSEKRRADLEAGTVRPHSFPYLFRRMIQLNRGQYWAYVIGVAASICTGMVYPVFGIVFGGVIGVFSIQDHAELRAGGDRYALYCFIIAIVATIAVGITNYIFMYTAEILSGLIRLNVFAAILRQDIAYFDRDENSTGHLTSAISDWAQKINGLFGVTMGVIIQSGFTLLGGSIIGLSYGWRVSLVGIACFPFTIAAGLVRLRVVVLKDAKNKKAHEQSAQMACEAAGAIRTVASLTREEDCCKIYSEYLEEPMRKSNRTAIFANFWYSLSQSLTFWVIGLIFWYGSRQLISGALTTRTFFIAMISIVFGSIQAGNVFSFVPDMSKARGAAADVVNLLDAVPEIDAESPSGDKFDNAKGHINFRDVHFRYPTRPHVRVLRGLDLEVKPGQFAAIVGPSGCGKSTLIQLVERFYDPLAGVVDVDGNDVSTLNVASYRSQIALVSQEPTLYAGTVRFNITLGANVPAEQVPEEDIIRACKDANIHDFVMSLPDGYNTEVGGKGAQLSGGQKQRIAIARALIRNPKILLLDEATSALDSESEKVVQKALDQAAKGRSTIAVAHRLSTIQNADVIYVLRDGKVAEKGRHFELLAKKGLYAELMDSLIKKVKEAGYKTNIVPVELNVTDEEGTRGLCERAVREFGRLDFFCANAGVVDMKKMWHASVEDYMNNFRIMAIGPMLAIKYASQAMSVLSEEKKEAKGSIVVTSALWENSRALGAVEKDTVVIEATSFTGATPAHDYILDPLSPDEVANVMAFLASDLSSAINAQAIVADRGIIEQAAMPMAASSATAQGIQPPPPFAFS